jgi:hypothetical protein
MSSFPVGADAGAVVVPAGVAVGVSSGAAMIVIGSGATGIARCVAMRGGCTTWTETGDGGALRACGIDTGGGTGFSGATMNANAM